MRPEHPYSWCAGCSPADQPLMGLWLGRGARDSLKAATNKQVVHSTCLQLMAFSLFQPRFEDNAMTQTQLQLPGDAIPLPSPCPMIPLPYMDLHQWWPLLGCCITGCDTPPHLHPHPQDVEILFPRICECNLTRQRGMRLQIEISLIIS